MKPSNNPGRRKAKALPNFEPNKEWGAARKNRAWSGKGVNWRRGTGTGKAN